MPSDTLLDPPQTPPPEEPAAGNGTALSVKKVVRKIAIGVIGGTVILAGVAMLILPGPGWVTIALGIGILATEFAWAARVYVRVKRGARTVMEALLPNIFHRKKENPPHAT